MTVCLEDKRNIETPLFTAVGFCDRLELYAEHLAIAGLLAPLTHKRAVFCLNHIVSVQLKAPGMGTGFLRFTLGGAPAASECVIFPPEALPDFEQIKLEIEQRMSGSAWSGEDT